MLLKEGGAMFEYSPTCWLCRQTAHLSATKTHVQDLHTGELEKTLGWRTCLTRRCSCIQLTQKFKLQARVRLCTGRFSTALERVQGGLAATLGAGSAGACHLPPSTLQASS